MVYKNKSRTRLEAGDGAQDPRPFYVHPHPTGSLCSGDSAQIKWNGRPKTGPGRWRRCGAAPGHSWKQSRDSSPSPTVFSQALHLLPVEFLNNTSSFHWREDHSWDNTMCGHLLYQTHCTVEGGGEEVEPLTFPAGSPCSPSPPLRWVLQPLAWPPLPKIPVGPQWPLCLGVHFLFRGPRPVNSGDQRAGSRSPFLFNQQTATGRGSWEQTGGKGSHGPWGQAGPASELRAHRVGV